MTNTNDAQRRAPEGFGADTASFAPQGRHAAPAHDAASRPSASASQGGDRRPQATGAMHAVSQQAAGAHNAQAKRPAQTGVLPDLSASLPTLSVEDVQQQPVGAPVITFDHVTKVYPAQPNRPSLHDISLQIYAGEFVFLVGHSGSGKSTFIKLITRELKPTDGHIYIAGEDLSTMRNWRVPYLRRNIGCVFQDFKLLPNKTVFENVAFALEVIGKSRHVIKTQVPEVLRLVGLQDKLDKRPDQLSGGEQQRVSIARAIVNRPPLLVCDEPTGNLDPQTSRGIMDLLERINRTGTTVLVATHDREMVDNMRRRVIALDSGQLTRDQDRGVYGFDV
ncbi:MAG: cell division ATP-binding protein FtsE [Slackia sp.]|nr:cell division ATP-binding protein FtsE [Slackia sp.]